MAISQTMSNPSDWILHPYQNDFSHTEIPPTNAFAAATTSATVSRNNNLSPEQGRVSKPIRRRSRASRRTPTTLLNTDTTNFRAMVQHFTGGPAAPFAAARSQITNRGGTTLNYMEHMAASNATAAPASGFHVQYPTQLQQHHMFMIDNMHGGGGGGGGGGLPPQAPPGNENKNYDNYML